MSSANINPRWVAPTPKKRVRSGATPAMRTPTQSSRSSRVREASPTPYREPVPPAPSRPTVDSVTPFPRSNDTPPHQEEETLDQPRPIPAGATETTDETLSMNAPAPTMRISRDDAKKMIAVAIILDFLLPIGAIAGAIIFFIWFKSKGVDLINGKKQFVNIFGNVLGEAFTAGIWAGVTVGVILTILFSWAEDKTGVDPLAAAKLLKGKTGGIPQGPTPST